MNVGQTRKTAETSYLEVSSRFRLFPRVGRGVGQDKKPTEPRLTHEKSKLKLYPQYPLCYASHSRAKKFAHPQM